MDRQFLASLFLFGTVGCATSPVLTGNGQLPTVQDQYEALGDGQNTATPQKQAAPVLSDATATMVAKNPNNAVEGKITPPSIKGKAAPKPIDLSAGDIVELPAVVDRPNVSTAPALSIEDIAELQKIAAEKAVTVINDFRVEHGLNPVLLNETLNEAALSHVVYMSSAELVTSSNEAGEGVGKRLSASGFESTQAGSVVSGGYPNIDAALVAWKDDEAQRGHLLMPDAEHLGFAIIRDRQSKYMTYIEVIVAKD